MLLIRNQAYIVCFFDPTNHFFQYFDPPRAFINVSAHWCKSKGTLGLEKNHLSWNSIYVTTGYEFIWTELSSCKEKLLVWFQKLNLVCNLLLKEILLFSVSLWPGWKYLSAGKFEKTSNNNRKSNFANRICTRKSELPQ